MKLSGSPRQISLLSTLRVHVILSYPLKYCKVTMASCDPPFDDEDLIGDYYDDDDDNYGPPQEFEDDYEDEIDRQGVEISGVEQRQETSQAVPGKKQQTTIPPVITFDTVTSKTKLNKDVKGVDAKLIQDKKLYSFDRCVDSF